MRRLAFVLALLLAMSVAAVPAAACIPEDPGIGLC